MSPALEVNYASYPLNYDLHDFQRDLLYAPGRHGQRYSTVLDNDRKMISGSFFHLLDRELTKMGVAYDTEFRSEVVFGTYKGLGSELQGISAGQEIRQAALVLTARTS